MPYNEDLADRVRIYLAHIPKIKIEEKKMFRGLVFMVNGKMCINISGENLMCRFDPSQLKELSQRKGFMPMIMRGKELDSYCYVAPEGFKSKTNFEFWVNCCLEFNSKAKASKAKKKSSKK